MRKWILASLAALAAGHVMAAPPECKLIRIEEWPVRIERNMPIIDGEINGNKVAILIDTGSKKSFVTRSAVARMMLTRMHVGATGLESVRLAGLRIGAANRRARKRFFLPGRGFGPPGTSPIPRVGFLF